MKVLVVGSGPSGIFSALPLLRGGISVIMVDGGLTLETSKQEALNQLTQHKYSTEQFSIHFKQLFTNTHTEHIKLPFGSDYVFRNSGTQTTQHFFSKTTASYCVGGLSQVWGAVSKYIIRPKWQLNVFSM